MTTRQHVDDIIEPQGFSMGFVSDFSWNIARMFLETFLASKASSLTSKERKTVADCLFILKRVLEGKKKSS